MKRLVTRRGRTSNTTWYFSAPYYSTPIKRPGDFRTFICPGRFPKLCGEKASITISIITKEEGSGNTVQSIRHQEERRKAKPPKGTYRDALYGWWPLFTSADGVHLPGISTRQMTLPRAHTTEHTVQSVRLQKEERRREKKKEEPTALVSEPASWRFPSRIGLDIP